MAENTGTAARLAQGRPAVDNVTDYVWACHLLGYQHPDLTQHRGQLHDWYGTEEGLDLRALEAECAALRTAAGSASEAVQLQENQLNVVSDAWQGSGAQASRDFLVRHGEASARAVAAVRAAAEALAELRDRLWQVVDAKVTAASDIEGRPQVQRAAWLAAARTVSTGLGDRSTASELVDEQVKPFVDNDIRGDWLTAMRAGTAAAADAYDAALAELRAGPASVFGIPGDLGPSWQPVGDGGTGGIGPGIGPGVGHAVAPSGATVPSNFTPGVWTAPPPAAMPVAPAGMPAPPVAMPMPASAPADLAGSVPPPGVPAGLGATPALGGGLPEVGAGLSGVGQQLADMFGGLIGSAAEGLPSEIEDPSGTDVRDAGLGDLDDESEPDEKPDDDDEADAAPDDDEDADDEDVAVEPQVEPGEPGTDVVEAPEQQQVPPEPVPVGPPEPVPAEPMAEPLAAPSGETPCEIAANELPQVGG